MAAGKDEHVAVHRPPAGDDAIRAGTTFRRALAVRTTIAEELPAGPFLEDVLSFPALVVAVIPFDQIWIDCCRRTETGQLAGAPGSLQRAGKHLCERQPLQPL